MVRTTGYVPDLIGLDAEKNADLVEVLRRNFDLISRSVGGALSGGGGLFAGGSSGGGTAVADFPDRVETKALTTRYVVNERVAVTLVNCNGDDAEIFMTEGSTLVEVAG
jgi:hypothetical protein